MRHSALFSPPQVAGFFIDGNTAMPVILSMTRLKQPGRKSVLVVRPKRQKKSFHFVNRTRSKTREGVSLAQAKAGLSARGLRTAVGVVDAA